MRKQRSKPQQQPKHLSQWQRDLNPEQLAGQNIGERPLTRPAAEVKEAHRRFREFTDDELAQIAIVAEGQRLEQGSDYLDLRGPAAEPLTATADMSAGEDHLYVSKAGTPYELWNRLIESLRGDRANAQSDRELPEATVDKTVEDSFPASDPPAWTTGREPPDPTAPQAPREKRVEPTEDK